MLIKGKFAFLFLLWAASAFAQQKPAGLVDSVARKAIEEKNFPSLAIGIVKGGAVVYKKTYGYANVGARTPATVNTVYQLGSVTKMFSGHVLAHLITENKMALTDPVKKFFPATVDFAQDAFGNEITVRNIATHSSGFPRYPANLERVDPEPIKGYTYQQLYAGIGLVAIDTLAGLQYVYSNFGYGVLGAAMEGATDKNLSELMQEYVFVPIGMTNSSLYRVASMKEKLATPYLSIEPYQETEPWKMEALAAAGNAFTTINDMCQFLLMLSKDTEVNRVQQTKYLKINETWNYGLGCFLNYSTKRNSPYIHHGGDIDGYSSYLILFPELDDFGMVVLTNFGQGRVLGPVIGDLVDAAFKEFVTIVSHEK